jgi:hypothetical protein
MEMDCGQHNPNKIAKEVPFFRKPAISAYYSFLLGDGQRDRFKTPFSTCSRVAMSYDDNHVRFLYAHNVYIINVFCKIQNGVLQGNAGSDLSALP